MSVTKKLLNVLDAAVNGLEPKPQADKPAPKPRRVADLLTLGPDFRMSEIPYWSGEHYDLAKGHAILGKQLRVDQWLTVPREQQRIYEKYLAIFETYGHDKASKTHREHKAKLALLGPDELAAATVRSQSEEASANRVKIDAAKIGIRACSAKALPDCKKIMEEVRKLAFDKATEIEQIELANAEAAGVEFQPSFTLRYLVQLSARALESCNGNGISPQAMISATGIVL